MDSAKATTKQWISDAKVNPLPYAWIGSAVISVFIPFVIFVICRANYNQWDAYHHEDEYSLGALIFIYIWSLLSFGAIAYLGWDYIRTERLGDKTFLVMLAVFGNASFIACLLAITGMRALDGHNWDGRTFSLFPTLLVMTYAFWTFLAAAFGGFLFFKKYNQMKQQQKQQNGGEDDAYQRQTDDEAPPVNAPPIGNLA